MEELSLAPRTTDLRSQAFSAYRRADVHENVAWRAPEPHRFDARPANDMANFSGTDNDLSLAELPGWVVVIAGGIVAAIMGAMLGGAMSL